MWEMCDVVVREVCDGDKNVFVVMCGLLVSMYFSVMKMWWLLENDEGVREAAREKDLCFGMIESWLVYKFIGGKVYIMDVLNVL